MLFDLFNINNSKIRSNSRGLDNNAAVANQAVLQLRVSEAVREVGIDAKKISETALSPELTRDLKNIGVIRFQLEQVLNVLKKEAYVNARKELSIEVSAEEVQQIANNKKALLQELKKSCQEQGINFVDLEKDLSTLSANATKKIKSAISTAIEEMEFNATTYEKLKKWGTNLFYSYKALEELFLQSVLAPLKSIIVISSEILSGSGFSLAYQRGIEAGSEKILELRKSYIEKYSHSYWGSDKEFAESSDFKIALKTLPISSMANLAFSGLTVVDIVFKEELGKAVFNSWNATAYALNYQGAMIRDRREFIRWWSHGVEAIEVLGACALVASSGGAASLLFGQKAFRVAKYLGSSGSTSYLVAVAQEWMDKESPDNYLKALENASANMGSSALFMGGTSALVKWGSSGQATNAIWKTKTAGYTASGVDFLDDIGDIQEAFENIADVGLGTLEEQKGAALQAAVALYSAKSDGKKPSNVNLKKDYSALLPAIEKVVLPEAQNEEEQNNLGKSRKLPAKIQIGEDLVDGYRSQDGKRIYLLEDQIKEKYFYSRLEELKLKNPLKSEEELVFQAKEESRTKAAFTDEAEKVCYLPYVSGSQRTTLGAEELKLKQIYYKSLEIHEVGELKALENKAFSIETAFERVERESARYLEQDDFLRYATNEWKLPEQGLGIVNQKLQILPASLDAYSFRSQDFFGLLRQRYFEDSSLAAAESFNVPDYSTEFKELARVFQEFSIEKKRDYVRKTLSQCLLVVYMIFDNNKFNEIENTIDQFAKEVVCRIEDKDLQFNTLTDILIRKAIDYYLSVHARNPEKANFISNSLSESFVPLLISYMQMEFIRNQRGIQETNSLSLEDSHLTLLEAGNVILESGAGNYSFTRQLAKKNPDALVVAVEPFGDLWESGREEDLSNLKNVVTFQGFNSDLNDSRLVRKAKEIFSIFPSPMVLGRCFHSFVFKYLAPGGKFTFVTEVLDQDRFVSGSFKLAQHLVGELLNPFQNVVEIRSMPTGLLPQRFRSQFWKTYFEHSDNIYAYVHAPSFSGAISAPPLRIEGLQAEADQHGGQLSILGVVGDINLSVVTLENYGLWNWIEIPVGLPSQTGKSFKFYCLKNPNTSETRYIARFSMDAKAFFDYVFVLKEERWQVFYNSREVGSLNELNLATFAAALQVAYLDLGLKNLSIEIDWKRLGVKTKDLFEVRKNVQDLFSNSRFFSSLKLDLESIRLSADETGIVVDLEVQSVSNPESKQLFHAALNAAFAMTELKINSAARNSRGINIGPVLEYMKRIILTGQLDKNILEVKFVESGFPVDSAHKMIAQLEREIDQQLEIMEARLKHGLDLGFDKFVITSNQDRSIKAGADIKIDFGCGKSLQNTSRLLMQDRNAVVIALDSSVDLNVEMLRVLKEQFPNLILHVGNAELVRDERLRSRVQQIDILFPAPFVVGLAGVFDFIDYYLASGGRARLVSELPFYGTNNSVMNFNLEGYQLLLSALLKSEKILLNRIKIPAPLISGDFDTVFFRQKLKKLDHIVVRDSFTEDIETVAESEIQERIKSSRFTILGETNDINIDYLEINDYSDWQKEVYSLKKAKPEREICVYTKGEDKVVAYYLLDDKGIKTQSYIFKKANNTWRVFKNNNVGNLNENASGFNAALNYFNQFCKKVLNEEIGELAIEVDFVELGIRTIGEQQVREAVNSYVKKNKFEDLIKYSEEAWSYEGFELIPEHNQGVVLKYRKNENKESTSSEPNIPVDASSQFLEHLKRKKVDFVDNFIGFVRVELKIIVEKGNLEEVLKSGKFETLLTDLFAGKITPEQMRTELDNVIDIADIDRVRKSKLLEIVVQKFINEFMGQGANVFIPYDTKAFYPEYFVKTFQVCSEIRNGKVGCVFAKPSMIEGKFYIFPITKNHLTSCTDYATRFYIDNPNAEVLYCLPEESPKNHEEARDIVYSIYCQTLRSCFDEIRSKNITERTQVNIGSAFSVLPIFEVPWGYIETILQYPQFKENICRKMAVDLIFGVVPGYYDERNMFDELLCFGMSPTYENMGNGKLHPRWSSHMGFFITKQSDMQKHAPNEKQIEKFGQWYQSTIGYKYSQGLFIDQIPYRESEVLKNLNSGLFNYEKLFLQLCMLISPEFVSAIIEMAVARNKQRALSFIFE